MKPNYFYQIEKQKQKMKTELKPYAMLQWGTQQMRIDIHMHSKYTVCTTIPFMKTITIKYIVHNKFMANLISFISVVIIFSAECCVSKVKRGTKIAVGN